MALASLPRTPPVGGIRDNQFIYDAASVAVSSVLAVCLQHELSNAFLRGSVSDWTEQCETTPIAIDRVLTRRERDVAATAAAPLPDCEPDQLQAVEHAIGEVQFRIREFALRVGFVVRNDLDDHDGTS